MAEVIICSDFGAPKNKVSHCFHCCPIYLPWSDGTKCHDLHFLNVEFKPDVSLSAFTFIKRLFSFSSCSAMRVVSSAYLRLLIFLPATMIPACASSSWAFLMMYSAYELSNQGDNLQPWHTPFLIWNQPFVLCSVFTVASRPAYRFLRRQIRWSGIPVSVGFPQFVVIHTVKGFGVVNKAEVDVFLELSSFSMIQQMLAIWSLVPLPFLKPAWTSGSSRLVHILLKPGLENFEHYFTSVWDECNCAVVWAFFSIAFLWDWNENWSFQVLWPRLSFPNLLAYWMQHFDSIIF